MSADTIEIDLFSDTATRPTPAMREAMAVAEVGDEQLGEDPTTNELERRVAALLGAEAAVLMPSGAMCNHVAFAVHCRPGDEIVIDATAHPVHYEVGGAAVLAGAQFATVDGVRGIFNAPQMRAAMHPPVRHCPRPRVVSIEQSTNLGGGAVWPLATMQEVSALAREHGLAVHVDGARLLNASVAAGVPAHEYGALADSIWIDLSKGLGAPVGAVLAGSEQFVADAWRCKQRFGGAMRQSGILAAAGLYALDHHVDRLAEDHANAKALARALAALPGVALDADAVETNIVLFDVAGTGRDAPTFVASMLERGVRFSAMGPTLVRAVTHLDVDAGDVARAVERCAELIERA